MVDSVVSSGCVADIESTVKTGCSVRVGSEEMIEESTGMTEIESVDSVVEIDCSDISVLDNTTDSVEMGRLSKVDASVWPRGSEILDKLVGTGTVIAVAV